MMTAMLLVSFTILSIPTFSKLRNDEDYDDDEDDDDHGSYKIKLFDFCQFDLQLIFIDAALDIHDDLILRCRCVVFMMMLMMMMFFTDVDEKDDDENDDVDDAH